MSKKISHYQNQGKTQSASNHTTMQKNKPGQTTHTQDFWKPFIAFNQLESSQRAAALASLGITETDPAVLGILTKSHFVIPGTTSFECQRCGECCRYARKVAQLTYEPCLYLTPENTCSKHDNNYIVCKWFPYWIYNSPVHGPLLTIKPYCSGFGKGRAVDYRETLTRITGLAACEASDSDGAYVIHEVLRIPGRADWAFPSKANIDALMSHILSEKRKEELEKNAVGRKTERTGEVHYAHHFTSGLLGGINDPLITINQKRTITDVNDSVCTLLKRERDHLIGRDLPSFFVNADRVAASVNACFSKGKETASAQRLRLPDESTLPVLLNALVYRDRADGLVHGSIMCITPVSAAVFAEVNQSSNYARGLLEASLDALMVIDRDGVVTDVNETVVRFTGVPREKLIGLPFKDLFSESEKAAQGIQKTFAQGAVRNYELQLLQPDGATMPVSFNATVYKDSDGVVQGVFAAARDIRERLAMIKQLQEAKNYARGLIECCIDLMVTIDRDGMITDANNAATVLTGRPREQIIGAPFMNFFDDPQKASAGVLQTFADGTVQNYQMNLITTTGKKIAVSFNATLHRNSDGAVLGVFAIARAIDSTLCGGKRL